MFFKKLFNKKVEDMTDVELDSFIPLTPIEFYEDLTRHKKMQYVREKQLLKIYEYKKFYNYSKK